MAATGAPAGERRLRLLLHLSHIETSAREGAPGAFLYSLVEIILPRAPPIGSTFGDLQEGRRTVCRCAGSFSAALSRDRFVCALISFVAIARRVDADGKLIKRKGFVHFNHFLKFRLADDAFANCECKSRPVVEGFENRAIFDTTDKPRRNKLSINQACLNIFRGHAQFTINWRDGLIWENSNSHRVWPRWWTQSILGRFPTWR